MMARGQKASIHNLAQQSFVSIADKRNKRDVWESSKYESAEQEASVRQGMSRDRGNNIIALRKNLPTQDMFVSFMRKVATPRELSELTDIPQTTIEHWFRTDESGFSYPSVEDWIKISEYVDDWSEDFQRINIGMTEVTYESDAIGKNSDEMRNKRDVWSVTTKACKEAHFATFPEDLIEPCILAGCPIDGIVLDPFFGSGTTGRVCARLNRRYVGIELNPAYVEIAERRTSKVQMTIQGF